MTQNKRMTKQQLVRELAKRVDTTNQAAAETLEHLRDIVIEQLTSVGVVIIPELVKLILKDKPATPERQGRNPFTKEVMTIKARPASKKVKAVPERALKESVS